jgi:hypothetical protein
MTKASVTLRQNRDQLGSRYLGASLAADGTLTIEGQDLGDGVERIFGAGNREYEWVWGIASDGVARLKVALECDDVLVALAERFSNDAADELKPFLDDHGIPYKWSWSRIGD